MFATALKGQDIESLLTSIASAPAGGAVAASAPVADAAPAAKKEGIYCILTPLQRRRKRRRKRKPMWIWVDFSETTTEEGKYSRREIVGFAHSLSVFLNLQSIYSPYLYIRFFLSISNR